MRHLRGVLTAGLVSGTAGSLAASKAMIEATEACNVTNNTWITVGDEGRSISMQSAGEESVGASYRDVLCVLDELGTPDSVNSRIGSTRALDGRQTATWDGFSASWGYHPDSGLDIVIDLSQE